MAALEILGLAKSYSVGFWRKKLRPALHPLSLSVKEGETFGFLGPNGAGKTTTLKLLMGIIFPTAGSAKILGRDFRDPEVKREVGFLPEQPYFYDYLTAPELLDYYARLSGVTEAERQKRISTLLERVGLADVGHKQLRKFSKGMLQRVGIAQAVIHDPKLIFLDEPMSGLDPIGRREMRELLQSLKDEGKTLFLTTHILSDAEALCDRVAVIHEGELRGIGVVEDLTSKTADKTELVWQGVHVVASLSSLLEETHVTGDIVRAVASSTDTDFLLEKLRQQGGRVISVTPLHGTLEDYFVAQTSRREEVKA
jgi:ABC-2 type transport system ATP-binding protein